MYLLRKTVESFLKKIIYTVITKNKVNKVIQETLGFNKYKLKQREKIDI